MKQSLKCPDAQTGLVGECFNPQRAAVAARTCDDAKLTIKGKSETVVVPVTFTQRDNMQSLDGTLPIKRLQFDIGTGEWKDTPIVADDVAIKFHIVATKF